MNRFMRMMPSSEVEKEQQFKVGADKSVVTVQAGKNGWTILYADSSSEYNDVIDTVDNNFESALKVLNSRF